ncbi:MAG: hypothetical protein Q9227_002802 [Pyrenula ochraceoflavens]
MAASLAYLADVKRSAAVRTLIPAVLKTVPSLFPDSAAEDFRYLDFFRSRSAKVLAGYCDAPLWNELVLQASFADPAVRHALVAVSYTHEQFESAVVPQGNMSPYLHAKPADCAFLLKHYNKAIKALVSRSHPNLISHEVMVVTCLLFIALEYFLGNPQSALMHLANGVQILRQYRPFENKKLGRSLQSCAGSTRLSVASPPKCCSRDSPNLPVIVPHLKKGSADALSNLSTSLSTTSTFQIPSSIANDVISPIFSRLSMLSSFFGQDLRKPLLEDCDVSSLSIPEHFSSILEARNALTTLLTQTFAFHRLCIPVHNDPSYVLPPKATRAEIQNKLDQWGSSFSLFLSFNLTKLPLSTLRGASILQVHHRIASIFLGTCYEREEVSFDAYLKDFEAIVALSENVVEENNFSFEMGTIPPLFWTALRCRHHVVRHKALNLLKHSPRRESLWDSALASRVVQRIFEIEEAGLVWKDDYNPAQAFQLVPEEKRVHDAGIYPCSPKELGEHPVGILMRPGGPETPLFHWFEYV